MFHYTFDEYENELRKMLAHIKNELRYANQDASYYNDKTTIILCKLRDALDNALIASIALNRIVN